MKIAYLAALVAISLAGCVDVSDPPMVSDYNGRTVKILDHGGIYSLSGPGRSPKDYPAYQLALDTCKLDGHKDAAYQGFRLVDQYTGEHIFLCI